MTYARVIVAAALQRYIEPPPVAVRAARRQERMELV